MVLYVHYLYVLGKIEKRQYPPRMTPQLRKDIMRFERCREQFAFLRENRLTTSEDLTAFQDALSGLIKQRTILNVQKKTRRRLNDALADVDALAEAKRLCDKGLSGMEEEAGRYMDAVTTLEKCGISQERLATEKAELYAQLAEINRDIRAERKKLALCQEILERVPQMEKTIKKLERKDVVRDEHWGR